MKILLVPVLKKLAAALVTLVPLGDVGSWLLKASFWTRFAIVSAMTLLLVWFFVKYLPNRRNRIANQPRNRVLFRKTPLPELGGNATFFARLRRNCLLFADWLIGMAVPEAKEAALQRLQSKEGARLRTRKRVTGIEPDAGPHRSLQRLFPARSSSRRHD